MDVFKIGSLNVNGARDTRKRAVVFEMVKMKHIDVLFLQETHSDNGNEADWSREWNGDVILSHNTTLSGVVAVLSGLPVLSKVYSSHPAGQTCCGGEVPFRQGWF